MPTKKVNIIHTQREFTYENCNKRRSNSYLQKTKNQKIEPLKLTYICQTPKREKEGEEKVELLGAVNEQILRGERERDERERGRRRNNTWSLQSYEIIIRLFWSDY